MDYEFNLIALKQRESELGCPDVPGHAWRWV
jgi:hypothetical protein